MGTGRRIPSLARMMGLIAAAAALTALAGPGSASADTKRSDGHRASLTEGDTSFWEWLAAPHQAELELITAKARGNLSALVNYPAYPYSEGLSPVNVANRRRLLDDAIGMLRYGLKLDPNHLELLRLLGSAAEHRGLLELAESSLERYLENQIPERIAADVPVALGRIYARQERWAEAIGQLRLSLGKAQTDRHLRTQATVTLASAYMNQGRLSEAIDVLRSQLGTAAAGADDASLAFALAVAYDRDEQLTRAHEVLAGLTAGSHNQTLLNVLFDVTNQRLLLTPAADQHYFTALQLEAMGHLSEAREEWLRYARTGSRYRARALRHVAELETMLDHRARKTGSPSPATPKPPKLRRTFP